MFYQELIKSFWPAQHIYTIYTIPRTLVMISHFYPRGQFNVNDVTQSNDIINTITPWY